MSLLHKFEIPLQTQLRARPTGLGRMMIIAVVLSTTIIASVAIALFIAWSGIFSIAASDGHWRITERLLEFGMQNSIKRHAAGIEAPPLDDPSLVRLGAGHFHRGCAVCHGAPGMPVNPIAKRMLPAPPDLTTSMRPWTAAELFWIVKHGIKYTGMPGWVALERDDEIWAVVAFLQQLPKLDAQAYRGLALGNLRVSRDNGRELATLDSNPNAISACARCHGADKQLPLSELVPVLHGQPVEFLAKALLAYAQGKRRSGIMQPLAADLSAEDIRRLADYYAGLRSPKSKLAIKNAALIEPGRKLAMDGAPDGGVPACTGCHNDASTSTPNLAGQHAGYLAGQLRLWKAGQIPTTDGARIMAQIARHLSEEQITLLSAYFAAAAADSDNSLATRR